MSAQKNYFTDFPSWSSFQFLHYSSSLQRCIFPYGSCNCLKIRAKSAFRNALWSSFEWEDGRGQATRHHQQLSCVKSCQGHYATPVLSWHLSWSMGPGLRWAGIWFVLSLNSLQVLVLQRPEKPTEYPYVTLRTGFWNTFWELKTRNNYYFCLNKRSG